MNFNQHIKRLKLLCDLDELDLIDCDKNKWLKRKSEERTKGKQK